MRKSVMTSLADPVAAGIWLSQARPKKFANFVM
jgi:hypothetical protein